VALYRALFGESPFPGDSFDQLKESVTSGALRVRPRPVRGFAWVVPILRRGLATDPADRYPTMGALLADLTRDPIVRRRQRLRTLALMLVTGLVVGGGIYGGRVAWQRWQQAELEARASEHLSRVDLEMERLRGAGKHEEAERLFEDFSAIIEYQGTRTLTSTWIRRAAAQVEARDYDAAASSLARAYTEATDPALERDALIALADVLVKQHRWLDAERTLAAARRVGPVDAGATSSMIRLGIDVALARRDFGRAASLASEGPEELRWVEAVANNLARSTMSTHVVRKSEVVRLHEPERVWLGADTPVLARLDAALTPIEAAPPGKVVMASSYRPGRDQYVATADGGMGLFYRATPTGVEPIAVLESPHATSVEAADLDLDGREEIYLGSRPLTVMQRTPEGWDRWEPHPESSSLGCWIRGLKATDLDGDGRQELIASCAEWDGYDVRVYEHDDESGALRLRARTMLGTVVGVESMRRAGGGEVLVAPKLEQYENSVVFPPERPLGGPPGIYLFRLEGDALVLDERVEIPPSAHGGPQMCTHPIIGDVDGDGLDDMILRGESRGRGPGRYRYAYLFRQRADGTFSAHAIGDIVVSSLDNIDDDPLPEWLVSDLSRGHAMGWLGVGELSQPSAPVEPARDEPRALAGPPEDGGPVYARLWERAARLREVGLEEEAAEAFERLASLAGTRRLQAAAWTRAASARASQFADAEAARLYELAASVDDPRAPLEAARSYRRAGDLAEALRVLERYGERASPETASELVELREHLSTLLRTRSLALEFQRGLPAGLRVLRPQTLELVPERHTLRARSLGAGALATYPVRWDGRELVLSVEVELRRAEYNSELVIALRRDGQERAPTLVLGGWGGAGQATYYIAALLATKRAQLLSGRNGPWRVRVRLSYMADTSFARLEIVDLERGERVYEHRFEVDDGAELLPGAYRLELGTMGHEGMVVAELERVEVLGARPDPAAETDDDAGARALVLDHVSDALRGLGPARAEQSTSSRARRLVALARLGRSDEVAQAARALLDAPDGAAAAHELLRLAPVTYLTAFRAAAGDGAFTLLRDAWLDRHHENAEVVGHPSALLPALADIDSLADHEALADLLEIRGDLRMHERDLVAARADLTRARALRVGQVQIGLEVRLAALAAALGDREGALEHARVVMARGASPRSRPRGCAPGQAARARGGPGLGAAARSG
ncbi:MAG: tetratricopeptide repeat protein, partial [Myxococcales bacterium]|nr:tetratricopeptide repeat protein [Myxococcales bacterium]